MKEIPKLTMKVAGPLTPWGIKLAKLMMIPKIIIYSIFAVVVLPSLLLIDVVLNTNLTEVVEE